VTFEEFLAWPEEGRVEWVDGEIVRLSPGSLAHQELLDFVHDLIKTFVRARGLGETYLAGVAMRLPTRPSGRDPDVLFVATEHLDRLTPTYINGPADLVVEIVSPDSVTRDRGEKFAEYEAAGIPEYWLIDPLRQEALFYRLGQDGRYHQGPIAPDGRYHSAILPGFWLLVEWLWQRPLPSAIEVMQQVMA
jgi:Uma2 family endonuclease